MHREDLIKKGYTHGLYSTKSHCQATGKKWKKQGMIKSYRVVKDGGLYELYVIRKR